MKKLLAIGIAASALAASAVSHKDFGRLADNRITAAPTRLTLTLSDGSSVIRGETRLTAADYLAQGWKRVVDEKPEASATNRYVYATGWTETDTTITRVYAEADIPPEVKPPRKFSKLKIYGAIAQLGAWDKIKSWLEAKDVGGINGWTAFQLAQEVSESHELFASLAEEARQLLGLTEADFNALLDKCVLEED